jgi:hypothetical protein
MCSGWRWCGGSAWRDCSMRRGTGRAQRHAPREKLVSWVVAGRPSLPLLCCRCAGARCCRFSPIAEQGVLPSSAWWSLLRRERAGSGLHLDLPLGTSVCVYRVYRECQVDLRPMPTDCRFRHQCDQCDQ